MEPRAEELEAVLLEHDGIREARVVRVPGRYGTARVVAYVAPAAGEHPLAAEDVLAWLSERVEPTAAPGTVVVLDEADADLAADDLPDPWQGRPDAGAPYEPPRDAVEETIAAVWADALGLDRVGVHDDFFALGGNSFLSVDVLARLGASGLETDARTFFENPTVAELAAALGARDAAPAVIGS